MTIPEFADPRWRAIYYLQHTEHPLRGLEGLTAGVALNDLAIEELIKPCFWQAHSKTYHVKTIIKRALYRAKVKVKKRAKRILWAFNRQTIRMKKEGCIFPFEMAGLAFEAEELQYTK